MKKFLSFAAMLMLLLVLAACNNDEKTVTTSTSAGSGDYPEVTFKLAHITPTDHMWHKASEKFKEELESITGGKMSVEIYPASQLGSEADMVQQVEAGSVDMAMITAAYLTSRTPEMAAWFAPYLFDTLEEANTVAQSDLGQQLLKKVEGTGLKGLTYLFAGQRTMVTKDVKINSTDDLDGLKLRVTPSPALQSFYRNAGAAPESLSLTEVYSALQTGVIDGMDMDLDATITNKYAEIAKYVAVTNHMVWPSTILTNEKKFNALSKDAQDAVTQAWKVASEFAVTTRAGQEEEFRKELESQGMEVYDLDASVFEKQIEAFDSEYGGQSDLIKQFIEANR
ncbi:TRAP transporter substrate-binding protein [Solibacillus daqui]|uniref:TRAP transporter substrate-binding protein n=1 Tax=Solibacillus daqui TaxID=2912187 RepID=UPI0023662865|nr:TRAP transporter substrate-binding protein [Solibacillus daqui]